ncbi:RNA polymerase sigma factor [Mangrovihabitans endophyticus]|uniref:RNA polymerase sigma factor SigK n=1 Tax=Mangrovihabitans endophyticus TaxID=1751298 RepID=A0A8J3BWS7_9ACTN|nr:RNA polymerase sigma factor [Mangrovihabitans endophyticus]GGK77468.1 RNA polymerase sigma factor SigK [Mangrovihabitans endophyticus]
MDDTQLATRFAEGGEEGFTAVYTAFRGPVFGMAINILTDPGLAEEATQQTFVGLWRGRGRYDPGRSLAAWVFGIARKTAIDFYRRERRVPVPATDRSPETTVEAMSAERLWEVWEVRRAVEHLPPDEAAIVRLAHYYQMTHSEIAEYLGVPVGTVKSRSHRAHRRLAESLGHLLDEPSHDGPAGPPGGGPDGGANDEVAAGGHR